MTHQTGKDGTRFRLWTQRDNGNGYVEEADTLTGDDCPARGSNPCTGNAFCTLTAAGGGVTLRRAVT
ncbi:hypothetical protein [Streptomyces sp. NPDC048659]|uniref:hypothetical protein n=1 Tax=Streptomyces sp. NPDC048659 TaxID=3155489 RepID=UPI003413AEE2